MNNDIMGAFIAGMFMSAIIVGIFQIGINVGLRTSINMLDGNYPAAMQFLIKHRTAGKLLPYILRESK